MFDKLPKKITRYLFPKAPPALLSWKYLLPRQGLAVNLHRRTFLTCLTRSPVPLRAALVFYCFMVWYLFIGWYRCWRLWQRHSRAIAVQNAVSISDQIGSLLTLAMLHGIAPQCYYQYRLYRYPRRYWLNFIFSHELPHWHKMMSPNVSQHSENLLSDKLFFAEIMKKQGLPAVLNVYRFGAGLELSDGGLFCKRDLFLKPRRGFRKNGCYSLYYDAITDQYALINEKMRLCGHKDKIKKYIDSNFKQDYLVQPLLTNHFWLRYLLPDSDLIVVRLITAIKSGRPVSICSKLEVPIGKNSQKIHSLAIDCETGGLTLVPPVQPVDEAQTEIDRILAGRIVYQWSAIKTVAEKAHETCMDIATVGWDLALTDGGVVLLEGNFNWGVAAFERANCQLLRHFYAIKPRL